MLLLDMMKAAFLLRFVDLSCCCCLVAYIFMSISLLAGQTVIRDGSSS